MFPIGLENVLRVEISNKRDTLVAHYNYSWVSINNNP
jgi:hypothetical protein